MRHHDPRAAGDRKPGDGFHLDIDTNAKVVKTAVGELPLSPVMDHAFWEARDRIQKRKPNSGPAANEFERAFRKNPFAMALATPIRIDAFTGSRLPSFFLQGFNMVAHPETDAPWWVPQDLTTEEEPSSGGAQTQTTDAVDVGHTEAVPTIGVDGLPVYVAGSETQPAAMVKHEPRGPSGYLLARQDLLESVAKPSGNIRLHERLFALSGTQLRRLLSESKWHENMDKYILDEMRRHIVRDILYLSDLCTTAGRYYIVKCFGWDDVKFKHQGAVLWFGDSSKLGDGVEAEPAPGPAAAMDVVPNGSSTQTSILVHNMPMLLGSEYAEKLRREAAVLKDGSIFMLAGRRTTKLQMRLWKLQCYLYHST